MPENTSPLGSPERQDECYDCQIFRILHNINLNLLTIFETVYIHKGIVNAIKILNITPSAISQSANRLRVSFPDPLFIHKGQGVMSTAYATHLHQYINRGTEVFLSALDIAGSPHQQRMITIAIMSGMGALLIPIVVSVLKPTFPQILLHNIAITDAARQLDQRQVDLLIDTRLHSDQAISHHVPCQDRVRMYCRVERPTLHGPQGEAHLTQYEFVLLLPGGQRCPVLHCRLQEKTGERRCGFNALNPLTQAAAIVESDILGLATERLFAVVSQLWPP